MSRFIPIDSNKHAAHGWKPFSTLDVAAKDSCTPVVAAELSALLPFYPLAFAQVEPGQFRLVALQGVHAGENLLVNEAGKWVMPYIPSTYRAYPFALRPFEQDGEKRYALCFDTDSELYREQPAPEQGEMRFFNADGSGLAEKAQGVLNFLNQRVRNMRLTQQGVDALAGAEVFNPLNLQPYTQGDREPLKGIYTINERKLAELNGESLQKVHQSGGLVLAHAQLLSLGRLALLQRLAEARYVTQSQASVETVEAMFGGNDDVLKFDF